MTWTLFVQIFVLIVAVGAIGDTWIKTWRKNER